MPRAKTPSDDRVTTALSKELHSRFRTVAAIRKISVRAAIEQAVETWIGDPKKVQLEVAAALKRV